MRSAVVVRSSVVAGAALALVVGGVPTATTATASPAGVVAPGFEVRQLVAGDPLNSTSGLAIDGEGRLLIAQALNDRISRLDPATGELTVVAEETDGPLGTDLSLLTGLLTSRPLLGPDDLAIGPDGDLFVANILGKNVTRMEDDGTNRRIVGLPPLGDGITGPNGIAFNAQGRLFVTDLTFSSATHPGGMWEVDPNGLLPPIPIVRGLPGPEGFAFGPDGLAYVPELFGGRIDVIDVDARTVRTLASGFGSLTSLKFDASGRIVAVENSSGKVWRIDRITGARTVLAQGERGLDNLAIAEDGTIYVSNFIRGGVYRVNEATGELDPVVPTGDLSFPFSLDETADGSLVVGDLTSVSRVERDGTVERLSSLLVDDVQLLTAGATQVGGSVYFTDFFLPPGNLFRLDPSTGTRSRVTTGFVFPWSVKEGRAGRVLVSDQGLGTIFEVDPSSPLALPVPVMTGALSASGLAYDDRVHTVYASSATLGTVFSVRAIQILGIEVYLPVPTVVASGLDTPEGIAVDADGNLLVVEAGAGRLLRIDPDTGGRQVVATGLATDIAGLGLPLLNYSADVVERTDGTIVVSGSADGSLIELVPTD